MSKHRAFYFALPLVALPFAAWAVWAGAADSDAKSAKSTPAEAKAKDDASKYIRVGEDAKGNAVALETAIAHFVPKGADRPGLQVDLVSAIHVGDAGYYEALNKRFATYDAVIYELVAPEGTVVPRGGGGERSNNPLSVLQHKFKEVLELEHQLVGVDYTKKNFVHGDLSPDQFFKSMKDKNESIWSMLLRLAAADASQVADKAKKSNESYWSVAGRALLAGVTNSPPMDPMQMQLMMAILDKNRALKLKRALASQLAEMDKIMLAFNGPEGSTIITERNKAALKVLAQQIKAGNKKIAIFYGGGHMSDMETRLTAEFNLRRDKEEWLEAWNLRDKK